jgi:hypothetical protein
MCQARSEGGRRCPVHQHQNIAAIRAAEHLSGLTRLQTERLFAELRREGRNAEPLSNMLHAGSIRRIRNSVANTAVAEAVAADLELSAAHDPQIDPASAYAQRALRERAVQRGQKLNQRFLDVASRTGYSMQEVAAKYKEFREGVDTSRGSENPPEYDQNTRRAAVIADLPYDRASVVALVKLNSLVPVQEERRVRLTPAPEGSHIHSYGYDEGRMEVVFNSNPERIYAYQNVPEHVWYRFSASESPGRVFAGEIRGNDDYAYDSHDDAEADAHRVRCAACGQFRAAAHSCPEREIRAALTTTDLTAQQITELVPDRSTDTTEPEVESDADVSIADESNQTEPEPEAEVEAEVTDTTTSTYLVPVAHIPAYDITTHEPFDEMPSDVLVEGEDVIPVVERPDLNIPAATPENQRDPLPFDPNTLAVYTAETSQFVPFRRGWNRPDGDTEIQRASEDIGFITGENNRVIKRFDTRVYGFSGGSITHHPGRGYVKEIRVTHRPKYAPELSYTAEEHEAAVQLQKEQVRALHDSGDVVALPSTASFTRKYKIDGNRTENPRIKTASATAFKQAINSGKAVVIPIEIEKFDAGVGGYELFIDDQGFGNRTSSSTRISGQVMVRRNAEGVMEVISNEHSLKCSCRDYREKYYCPHVNYVQRHVGNLAQQMTPDPNAARAARAARPEGTHRLMSSALLARGDAQVITPEEGEAYVAFSNQNGTRSEQVRSSYSNVGIRSRLIVPERLRPANADSLTPDELTNMGAYNITAKELMEISTPVAPAGIRTALRRSDVDIPVSANYRHGGYRYSHSTGTVTGNIRYKKTDDIANTEVVHSSLQCTCAVYAATYDCQHVRVTKDQHLAVLGIASRTSAPSEKMLATAMARHGVAMRAEQSTMQYMAENNVTRDQVEAHRAGAAAREAAERRRRQEQRAEEARREAEAARARNQSTVDEHNAYRERMKERWETVEEKYSDNPKAFYEDYKAALSRKRAGEEAIPFRTENVTDGICADEPGARSFGIELEFDISDGVNRREALNKIGQELHAAGLTENDYQTSYHSAQRSGWAKWSFEEDCTVSGELVSPIMKDTPEHWEQLRVATEIITRNGGIATRRTGSHVHVSTGSYEQSTAKHAELLRTVNNNEDLMYRLASNPATGKHRGGQWCQPNSDDEGDQFISAEIQAGHDVLGYHESHGYALNFEGTSNSEYRKSHVEFRMWDGTLDPAVIQQQVMISAALTDHAERSVIANNGSTKPARGDRVRKGTGKVKDAEALEKASTQTHTEETFKESNMKAAEFFDKLFRRREDRAVAASLFAVTNWQTD